MQLLITRTFTGPPDLQLLLDFLPAVRRPDRLSDYPGLADLRELICLPEIPNCTRLWLSQPEKMVAFAMVDPYNNLLFEILPGEFDPELVAEIFAWGIACTRRSEETANPTLDAVCREDDMERIALLEKHGFVRQPEKTLRFERSLAEPIPAPVLPAGFSIRPASGEPEVPELVELHREAFGTDHMSATERLAMMSGPDYDPELDLVVTTSDGRLAAYCFCAVRASENSLSGRLEGWTDPIATHPDFRRKGLARALLLAGLSRLKQRGIEYAHLGTSSENTAMQAVAAAAGFTIESIKIWFSKAV
jgi:ribosomal protein S18 acetylase RimI-like enzyme